MRRAAKNAQWGSHIPILCRVVDKTDGAILEMGTGAFSTAVLDVMCQRDHRQLVSLENDQAYYRMARKYRSDYHTVRFIERWDFASIEVPWGVALVDHRPLQRRRVDIERLATWADVIVAHDSQRYDTGFERFRYWFNYTRCSPPTMLMSNTVDVGAMFG